MIKRAASLADLERLEKQHGASFDHIHPAAAITQAAQLASAGAAAASFHPLLGRLWQQWLRPQLDNCGARQLANIVWACAKLAYAGAALLDSCLERLVLKAGEAAPQELANAVYAAALLRESGFRIGERQARQLVAALVHKREDATPQALSNALWAAAKCRADFAPEAQQGQLTGAEAAVLQLAEAISSEQKAALVPQDISNSLWALSELGLRPPRLTALLAKAALRLAPAMKPQHVSNTAMALAKLGCGDAQLYATLVEAASKRVESFNSQDTCNLCWAVAVADQRQLSGAVVALCRPLSEQAWGGTVAEERHQLHQVHLWLLDQQPGGSGLAGVLSAAQLQQCAGAWEAALQLAAQQARSGLEQHVFACAQWLPGLAACSQETHTADRAFSVDVAATHAASGWRLAIEADGPTHFLRPGREVAGHTLARNRALAARGYVVVSVPYWEWDELKGDAARQAAYLQGKVEVALAACPVSAPAPAAALAPGQPQPAGLAGMLQLRKRRRQQRPSKT